MSKYVELDNISCLYKYGNNSKIYVVRNSNYGIAVVNTIKFGKINDALMFINVFEQGTYGPRYVRKEEFFDRIPEEAMQELVFHLDLFK